MKYREEMSDCSLSLAHSPELNQFGGRFQVTATPAQIPPLGSGGRGGREALFYRVGCISYQFCSTGTRRACAKSTIFWTARRSISPSMRNSR